MVWKSGLTKTVKRNVPSLKRRCENWRKGSLKSRNESFGGLFVILAGFEVDSAVQRTLSSSSMLCELFSLGRQVQDGFNFNFCL
mmetsp:Transcript_21881/g.30937  ORF Transcript_21881/g.30937 Transcript_21881/m.30937 type:complete len:84 (+) Transcript_21881:732-983(+)